MRDFQSLKVFITQKRCNAQWPYLTPKFHLGKYLQHLTWWGWDAPLCCSPTWWLTLIRRLDFYIKILAAAASAPRLRSSFSTLWCGHTPVCCEGGHSSVWSRRLGMRLNLKLEAGVWKVSWEKVERDSSLPTLYFICECCEPLNLASSHMTAIVGEHSFDFWPAIFFNPIRSIKSCEKVFITMLYSLVATTLSSVAGTMH